MVKISKGNQKIGKVWNVSLTPIKTCSDCVGCKKKCYAMKSYKMYQNVRTAWDHNTELAYSDMPLFFESIAAQLEKARKLPALFRWHVAGDIPHEAYLHGIDNLAFRFPSVKFLVFTKRYEWVNEYLNVPLRSFEKNLTVILSAWPSMPIDNPHSLPVAWVQDGTETRIPDHAYQCSGNCEQCAICWKLDNGEAVVFESH